RESATPAIPALTHRRRQQTQQGCGVRLLALLIGCLPREVNSCRRHLSGIWSGSAALTASSRAASLNGLIRHSMAPRASRRGRIDSSARPGDKHNWNLLPAPAQFLLKVGTRHLWHRDVEEQTAGLADDIRCEERFGG